MNAFRRIIVAASAALLAAGVPAFAQETTAPPPQTEVIGDPQLRNFSINGTVTVPATESPAQSAQTPPRTTERAQQPPAARATAPERAPTRTADRPEASDRDRTESAGATDVPQATPARRVAEPVVAAADEPTGDSGATFAPAAQTTLDVSQGGVPMLPWLIAALAFAAAAAWYFLRQRQRESYAGAGRMAFDAPASQRSPVRPAPAAAPAAAPAPKPAASGIVSTRLRPWLEIEFTPQRAMVDDEKAAVAFELSVFNSGSAPARDVLLEASLFNAGPRQDQQIKLFFDNPVAKGDRIPIIPPLQRVTVDTAVFLKRDQVQPIEVEGRQLFVPMIAFNALYGWGNDKGQSSTSYLVGKQTKGEKLAPFRLDLGPRVFRNLAAREHQLRLRK